MKVERKHPLAIRWNHWINFPALLLMVWSGLMIYWANPAYFLPQSLLDALGLNQRLGEGLGWHLTIAFVFVINGVVYFTYLLVSGEWRYLWPGPGSLRDAVQVMKYELMIPGAQLPAQIRYNAAQRWAYCLVIALGAGATLTGFAMYKPVQLNWLTALLGGYKAARLEHFLIMIALVLFFCMHVAQVARAGWNCFRAMITGLEVKTEEAHVED